MKITIETLVKAPLSNVWNAWISADDITQWNSPIETWHCPTADINLEEGGQFSYRMEAKDGSMGFDFAGNFTKIITNELIHFELDDKRKVTVDFIETDDGTKVVETFDAEEENSAEQQQQGWQSILDNFKRHVESKVG